MNVYYCEVTRNCIRPAHQNSELSAILDINYTQIAAAKLLTNNSSNSIDKNKTKLATGNKQPYHEPVNCFD